MNTVSLYHGHTPCWWLSTGLDKMSTFLSDISINNSLVGMGQYVYKYVSLKLKP